jgi:antitoxin ParD1/3/4
MIVNLTPELERLVENRVQSGRYNSATEVILEALRLLEENEKLRVTELRELQSQIDKGLDQAERGEGVDGELFMQGLIDDLDLRESNRKAG